MVAVMAHIERQTIQQAFKSVKEDTRIGFITKLDESEHVVFYHELHINIVIRTC
jgi:hypothetical protein